MVDRGVHTHVQIDLFSAVDRHVCGGRGEDRERALAAGSRLHLSKPIDPERLSRRHRRAHGRAAA